jgi:hypothetical protein
MSKNIDKNMFEPEILKNLIEFGLSENEAKIYSALLQTIAEIAGIKRTTTYSTLDGLIKQGLARYDDFGIKRKIVPENPQRLKITLEQKQLKLNNCLPNLEALFNMKGNKSFIKYYRGLVSIKPLYEKMISDIHPNEEYFVISNQKMWHESDPDYFEDFSIRRGRLPIKLKMIFEQNERSREYFKKRQLYNADIRFLPKNVTLETNLVITPQRTLIHQLIQPISALVIENESFITMHQEMFRLIWNSLPPLE